MQLKVLLVAMTLVAVVSDTMLLPFYPQYFAERFGETDPEHVGAYIAAICLTAMLALPCWARLARGRCTMRLMVFTQCGAGLLSVACALCDSLPAFWALSLAMIVCKASYLLVYPYLMEGEPESQHTHTIGVLSIVVHFGSIAGALLGGSSLQYLPVEQAFIVMAAGDFLQMALCIYLLKAGLARPVSPRAPEPVARGGLRIHALGVLMLVFYFSEYQVTPFFVEYWRSISPSSGPIESALVYAIPAGMALLALHLNGRSASGGVFNGAYLCLSLGMLGLLLQASGHQALALGGRCLYGWALFQLTVRLDTRLFEISTPASYARDYSTINLYQNVGVLSSSFAAGALIASHGLRMPFWLATAGLALSFALYPLLTRSSSLSNRKTAHAIP